MLKKRVVLIILLIAIYLPEIYSEESENNDFYNSFHPVLISNTNTSYFKFGWNIGNIKMSYDVINKSPIFDSEILHFNLLYKYYSIGFNIIEFYNLENDEYISFSIFPVSIAIVPVNYKDVLFFSIYGKFASRHTQLIESDLTNKDFYGSIGTKLFLFPKMKFNYSLYFSVFTEYNTKNELRIGLGMDLSWLGYIALLAFKEDAERRYGYYSGVQK